MKFRLPEKLRKKGTDSISVGGVQYTIDKDGYFEAPAVVAGEVAHIGIRGTDASPEKVISAAPAPPPSSPTENTSETATEGDPPSDVDMDVLDEKIVAGTATKDEIAHFVDSLKYEELAVRLEMAGVEIPNKKVERQHLLTNTMFDRMIKKASE